jgi:hypothetical protein
MLPIAVDAMGGDRAPEISRVLTLRLRLASPSFWSAATSKVAATSN